MFGLDDLIDSAFSWATDAIGSGLNAGLDSLGLSQHGRDQYFNRAMMREQMDWQSGEAQKNRDYQTEMYERQLKNYPELLKMQSDSDFNRWKNQFNIESSYNSQGNLVARDLVAGINPASQGSSLTQGVSMSPSSSAPPNISGSPVGNPSPVGIPSTGMSRGLLSEIGSFMRDVQEAKNLQKQTGRYDEYMDSLLAKFEAETENKEEATRYQQILTAIKQVYGNTEAMYTNAKLLADAYDSQTHGDYNKANSLLAKAEENLANKKGAEIDERLPYIKGEMQTQIKLNSAKIREANARAFEASQTGSYYKESTETLKQLRPYSVKFEEYKSQAQKFVSESAFWQSLIERDNAVVSSATKQERISYAIKSAEQQGLINDKLGYDIQQAMAKGEYAEAKELMGLIESGVNIGTNIGRARSLDRMATNQEIRNQIDANYSAWKMSHEEYINTYDSKGKLKSQQHRYFR